MSLYLIPAEAALVDFALAATALLGSPGPGIAALIAVGRQRGIRDGLAFYASLQIGLAIACALSVAGIATLIALSPILRIGLTFGGTLYLLWLAWRTATAPIAAQADANPPFSSGAGFLLGIANPKAYLAFASLAGAFTLVGGSAFADAAAKWAICVTVMMAVDLAWLWAGALFGRIAMRPATERAINIALALMIVAACVEALL